MYIKTNNSKRLVKRFLGLINYHSGETYHYEKSRFIRNLVLTNKLGSGVVIDRFIVDEPNEDLQIQEIYDNAIIVVYSFVTHKKITTFAPSPKRILSLYEDAGEIPPKHIIEESENNVKKELNQNSYLK